METATTISTSIDSAEDKAKYDAACKQVLAEKIKSGMATLHYTLDQAMDVLDIDPNNRDKYYSLIS